jgi:hypothetical protein
MRIKKRSDGKLLESNSALVLYGWHIEEIISGSDCIESNDKDVSG